MLGIIDIVCRGVLRACIGWGCVGSSRVEWGWVGLSDCLFVCVCARVCFLFACDIATALRVCVNSCMCSCACLNM